MKYRYHVFHGTALSPKDVVYSIPCHDVSIFNASFYSTNSDLAKEFSTSQLDSEEHLFPVLLEGIQQLKNPYIINEDKNPFVEFGVSHVDALQERQLLFDVLRKNHDGVVYHNQKNEPFEIVAFNENSFILKSTRILINDTWSRPMEFDQLERVFERWKEILSVEPHTLLSSEIIS